MALSGGLEAVEAAVAATLRAFLTAELDAVWAAAGDVATVPKPYPGGWTPNVGVGLVPLQMAPPVLQVYSRQGTNPLNAETRWGEFEYPVLIQFMTEGDSLPYLDKQSKRFAYAIVKVLQKHPTLDDSLSGPAGVLIAGIDAGTPRADDLKQMGVVRVLVRVEETVSNY